VGFISTLAAARPVLHHYMVQNREIPKEFVARFPDFLPLGGKNGRLCGQGEARRGVALSNCPAPKCTDSTKKSATVEKIKI